MIASPDTSTELRALAEAIGNVPTPCQVTDADLWFEPDTTTAVSLCLKQCHALEQCRAYALTLAPKYGVWAGVDHHNHKRKDNAA